MGCLSKESAGAKGTIPLARSDSQYYLIFKETAGTAWFDSGDLTWAP